MVTIYNGAKGRNMGTVVHLLNYTSYPPFLDPCYFLPSLCTSPRQIGHVSASPSSTLVLSDIYCNLDRLQPILPFSDLIC